MDFSYVITQPLFVLLQCAFFWGFLSLHTLTHSHAHTHTHTLMTVNSPDNCAVSIFRQKCSVVK